MATFDPKPEQAIQIGGQTYTFVRHEHARAMNIVHASTGAKGTVYRLRDAQKGFYALKVFHEQWRIPQIVTVNGAIRSYYDAIPGIMVCKREIIKRPQYAALLQQHPDLEYAVLMPWVAGDNWENFWGDPEQHTLKPEGALTLARNLAEILVQVEQSGAAHCDLAGSNIMIDVPHMQVELIDIEDSYLPGIAVPVKLVAGTSGYQHRTSRASGQWNAFADRFAGGLLLCELLSWPIEEIRAAAGEDVTSYFQDSDLADPRPTNKRYQLLHETVKSGSPEVADLLATLWKAPHLEDCPPLTAWLGALKKIPAPGLSRMLDVPQFNTIEYQDQAETEPVFTWRVVLQAESYEIQICSESTFSDPKLIYRGSALKALYRHLPIPQFARIRALAERRVSAWSSPCLIGRLQSPQITINELPNSLRVRLSWQAIRGADYYKVITPTGTFSVEALECSVEPNAAGLPGSYSISVCAETRLGKEAASPLVKAQVIIRPIAPGWLGKSAELIGQDVYLTWGEVKYATGYRIYYVTSSGGVEKTQFVESSKTSAQLKILIRLRTCWLTALCNDLESQPSQILSLDIDPVPVPEWITPPKYNGLEVQLAWNDVIDQCGLNAKSYQYMVAQPGMKSVVTSNSSLTLTLMPGTHTFQVAILHTDGLQGEWSTPLTVTVDLARPTILGPESCEPNAETSVYWTEVPHATHYFLFDYGIEGKQRSAPNRLKSMVNSRIVSIGRSSGMRRFTVQACVNEIVGPESDPFFIHVLAQLNPPRLKNVCLTVQHNEEIRLVWFQQKGATDYELQCAEDSTFQLITLTIVTEARAYLLNTTKMGRLFYRVRSRAGEQVSAWVEAVIDVMPPPPQITRCEPSGLGTFIEWQPHDPSVEYHIQHDVTSDFETDQAVISETRESFMNLNEIAGFVRVRVHNGFWSASVQILDGEALTAPTFGKLSFEVEAGKGVNVGWQSNTLLHNPLFELQLAPTPDFAAYSVYSLSEMSYLVESKIPQSRYARVVVRRGTLSSLWSETARITFLAAAPKTLKLKADERGIKAEWEQSGADQYEVEWADNKSFNSEEGISHTSIVKNCYARLAVPSGKLYVRVRADQQGNWTSWSRVETVQVDRAPLQSLVLSIERMETPASDTGYKHQFEWNTVPGAAFYTLELLQTEPVILWQGNETSCEIALMVGHSVCCVTASDGALESVSQLMTVDVLPDAPDLNIAVNGSQVTVSWEAVGGATHYVLLARPANVGSKWNKKTFTAEVGNALSEFTFTVHGIFECMIFARNEPMQLNGPYSPTVTFEAV